MYSQIILVAAHLLLLITSSYTKPNHFNNKLNIDVKAGIFGGVTNIKEVINNSVNYIEVKKTDYHWGAAAAHQETTDIIIPNGGVFSGDMWVPWVNNTNDFSEHKMEIMVNGRLAFYIWQTGDYVRYIYNGQRYYVNAPPVPGLSKSGGERKLIFETRNNRLFFRFEEFRR